MTSAIKQRGAALLVALMVVALATVLAVGLFERDRQTLARSAALEQSERSYQYALGMDLLAADLLDRAAAGGLEADAINGQWTPVYEVPGGRVQGRLLDLNARFNVNALASDDPAQTAAALAGFERLLQWLELDPIIARELADWVQPTPTLRPGSAGDGWYANQRPGYRRAGLPMAHVSELRWLRSVDEAAYRRLSAVTTAVPERRLVVNPNTVEPLVLAALVEGLEPSAAMRVLADGPYARIDDFLARLAADGFVVPGLQAQLTTTSRWFLAQARVVAGGLERDYFRLMDRQGSGYDFRWFSQGTP